jgi:hypothetical protein
MRIWLDRHKTQESPHSKFPSRTTRLGGCLGHYWQNISKLDQERQEVDCMDRWQAIHCNRRRRSSQTDEEKPMKMQEKAIMMMNIFET